MTKTTITPIEGAASLPFDDALESVKGQIEQTLTSAPLLIRGYTRHLTGAQGKGIRAISLLACALDEEGLIHPNGVAFAAAIELLHLATLVHDDVIDDAETRRGLVTLQRKYGKRTAVICGDYLLCTALKTAVSVPNRREYAEFQLPEYADRVCLGELNQHINNGNLDLSVYRYLKIIRGKTAALFEASFYAGAVLSTGDEHLRRQYLRLGRYIGMIFQLTDDCIDFEEDASAAQKPVQSDYEQGVITLPLIHALEQAPEFKRQAQAGKVSRAVLNSAVIRAGGLTYTHLVAQRYYKKALGLMDTLALSPEKASRLRAVLDKAYYGLQQFDK